MDEKLYKVECCNCKKTIYATKSIFHEMGMFDLGKGKCCHCNTDLKLIYNPETDSMTAKLYHKYKKDTKCIRKGDVR